MKNSDVQIFAQFGSETKAIFEGDPQEFIGLSSNDFHELIEQSGLQNCTVDFSLHENVREDSVLVSESMIDEECSKMVFTSLVKSLDPDALCEVVAERIDDRSQVTVFDGVQGDFTLTQFEQLIREKTLINRGIKAWVVGKGSQVEAVTTSPGAIEELHKKLRSNLG